MMSDRNRISHWYHCFVDDNMFERFWHGFWKYKTYFSSVAGLISTDFSIYRDIPEETQIRNCYRNRVMAYAMQKLNPNIIPTAGFGGENTWEWCFDGLPHNSTVGLPQTVHYLPLKHEDFLLVESMPWSTLLNPMLW